MRTTAALSKEGQIALPESVRQQLGLVPGDDFEVAVEGEDTITLRRIGRQPANRGLVDLLLACPAHFAVPARESDDTPPLSL